MGIKDIKAEARAKLALNMHQAVLLYTVEYAVLSIMIVMIVLACVSIGSLHIVASVVFICYGCIMLLATLVGIGILCHATVDYYLASYKCKPYNVRRLGDTLARNGLMKVLKLSAKRVLIGFLLLLCLIVPGVIYLMRTSMASYLLVANPKMKASTAISASSKVMGGKVGSYFSLMMSLFGWWTLGILSFGLGFIFILPYINMCKTVYYKRNLQGDKTVYKTVVQPISPPPQAQGMPQIQQMQMQQQMPPQAAMVNNAQAQQQPQIVPVVQSAPQPVVCEPVSAPLPPIDALGEEDKSDLNAAIIDLESEPQVAPVVPEVPITPSIKTTARPSENIEKVNIEKPQNSFEPSQSENFAFKETVKPLTTREVEESDVMTRKIDSMFSGAAAPQTAKNRDYIRDMSKSGPNDFVTCDSDTFDGDFGSERKEESVAVMSDADFEAFIRSFDVPETDSEFKPLTRNADANKENDIQSEKPRNERPRTIQRDGADGESRLDRIRREREERRRNSGNR